MTIFLERITHPNTTCLRASDIDDEIEQILRQLGKSKKEAVAQPGQAVTANQAEASGVSQTAQEVTPVPKDG